MKFIKLLLIGLALLAGLAQAEIQTDGTILRIGGEYRVERVEPVAGGTFLIEFRSEKPTGRFDVLRLESDHVHVAVKVGQVLRLSAEILKDTGREADVAQVVVFLPNATGPVPVWLLSNKMPQSELRGSRYLEMHSPLNDYEVM